MDATLAAYLAELHDQGRAPGKRLDGGGRGVLPDRHAREPSPAGERLARVLAGYRRTGGDRVLVTCHRTRRRGRGCESDQVARERGRLDAVIAGLLFMAGMRRSEVSALRWADVADAADDDGILVTVRRSTTNQETRDVRFVKAAVARAIWTPARVPSFAIRPAKNSRNRETASTRTRVRWGSEIGCPDWEGEW